MGKRRTFTEGFKRNAVEHSLNSDKTVKEIAKNLGIKYGNLTRWGKKYRDSGEHAFSGNGKQKLKLETAKIYWQHKGRYGSPRITSSIGKRRS